MKTLKPPSLAVTVSILISSYMLVLISLIIILHL